MSEDVFENKTTTDLQSKEESEQNILTPDMRTTEVLPNLYSMLCWSAKVETLSISVLFDEKHCQVVSTYHFFFLVISVYHLHQTSKKLLLPLSKVLRCHHPSFRILSNQLESNVNLFCGFQHVRIE